MLELKGDWPRTLEEFRVWHERQPEVYGFIDGVPRLMAPGPLPHSLIKGNVYAAMRARLRGSGCHAIVEGARLKGKTFRVSSPARDGARGIAPALRTVNPGESLRVAFPAACGEHGGWTAEYPAACGGDRLSRCISQHYVGEP